MQNVGIFVMCFLCSEKRKECKTVALWYWVVARVFCMVSRAVSRFPEWVVVHLVYIYVHNDILIVICETT